MKRLTLPAGRFTLRPWADPETASPAALAKDVAALIIAYADPDMARFVSWRVRDGDEALAYLRTRADEWNAGTRCSFAVIDRGDAVAGEIGIKEIDRSAGTAAMAVWTHPAFRGRGVAAQAVGAAAEYALSAPPSGLGLQLMRYTHSSANAASGVVAERAGFHFVGPEFPDADTTNPRADRILWIRP